MIHWTRRDDETSRQLRRQRASRESGVEKGKSHARSATGAAERDEGAERGAERGAAAPRACTCASPRRERTAGHSKFRVTKFILSSMSRERALSETSPLASERRETRVRHAPAVPRPFTWPPPLLSSSTPPPSSGTLVQERKPRGTTKPRDKKPDATLGRPISLSPLRE